MMMMMTTTTTTTKNTATKQQKIHTYIHTKRNDDPCDECDDPCDECDKNPPTLHLHKILFVEIRKHCGNLSMPIVSRRLPVKNYLIHIEGSVDRNTDSAASQACVYLRVLIFVIHGAPWGSCSCHGATAMRLRIPCAFGL